MIDDQQLIENGLIIPFETDVPGNSKTFTTPIQMSNEPQRNPERGPRVGEHSDEILRELGFADKEISTLAESGIVRIASYQTVV